MKRQTKASSVRIELPSSERRKELKRDPSLVDSIDEEIWLTRSRISALNGVVNGLLSLNGKNKRTLDQLAGQLCWGLYTTVLSKDTKNSVKINRDNIADSNLIAEQLEEYPSYDFHRVIRDEELGLYHSFVSRNGVLLGGLTRSNISEAHVGLLAVFAIDGLNDKLEAQLASMQPKIDWTPTARDRMIERLSGRVLFEDQEE